MKTCPQCGYERTKTDDDFISAEECPRCGIFYKKWKPPSDSQTNKPIKDEKGSPTPQEPTTIILNNGISEEDGLVNPINIVALIVLIYSTILFIAKISGLTVIITRPNVPFLSAVKYLYDLLMASALLITSIGLFRRMKWADTTTIVLLSLTCIEQITDIHHPSQILICLLFIYLIVILYFQKKVKTALPLIDLTNPYSLKNKRASYFAPYYVVRLFTVKKPILIGIVVVITLIGASFLIRQTKTPQEGAAIAQKIVDRTHAQPINENNESDNQGTGLVDCQSELENIFPLPIGTLEQENSERIRERQEMREKIFNLVRTNNVKGIDEYARQLRTGKLRNIYGLWKLFTFYGILTDPPTLERGKKFTDKEWQDHIQRLTSWIRLYPNSITVRVAAAEAVLTYGWNARGSGFANTVTEEQWRFFHEKVAEAEEILDAAKRFPEKCPQFYISMLDVARAQGWDIERFNEVFNEAVRIEPYYYDFYISKAVYLMPRWYGGENDVRDFAEDVLTTVGGKEGYRIYYIIAAEQLMSYDSKKFQRVDFLKETGLSWEKIVKGFNVSQELYGERVRRLNDFCYMAVRVKDWETVRRLMRRIGNNVSIDTWGSMEKYLSAKHSAFRNCK